jgi:hypothetical protein
MIRDEANRRFIGICAYCGQNYYVTDLEAALGLPSTHICKEAVQSKIDALQKKLKELS